MARITTEQNKIYKAHKNAWLDDNFDYESVSEAGNTLHDKLREGKTFKSLWWWAVEKNVSITSQIAMTHKVLSVTAEKQIRDTFKRVLTGLAIK